jgi:imidazolonepropionase-like amidohydrolase
MGRLVIHNVSYFDAQNKVLIDSQTVIISKNKFSKICNSSDYEKNEEDTIIDGTGKFLFPGLIDCHVHLSFQQEFVTQPYESIFRTKDGEKLLLALKNVQMHLVSGFTTLRDCGSRWKYMMASLRDSITNGTFFGPRLLVSDVPIVQPGNQEEFGPEFLLEAMAKEFYVGSGKDSIIQAVRERKRCGADFIKTTTTGGVLHGKGSKVDLSLWTMEELEAMNQEAERIGMHVAVHAHFAHGVLKAVQAGVRTIEHGTFLNDEIIDLMIKKGTYLVPTQSAGTFILNASEEMKKKIKPEALEKWERVSAEMVKSHKLAYEKGVKIAFGTDLPVSGSHGFSAIE